MRVGVRGRSEGSSEDVCKSVAPLIPLALTRFVDSVDLLPVIENKQTLLVCL